ncbi:MAG: PAS domain-containing protein [Desulfobacterales bacterium]|nr:PAS domain-containing protein [Desulfobacterales bacterium]
MGTLYQHSRQFSYWAAWLITGSLFFPAAAMAQSPGGSGGGGHQIQPVLTLALVLTSLVLFFFYLFQKNKSHSRAIIDDRDSTNTNKHGEEKTAPRPVKTDKALLRLFRQNETPMAKFTLGKGEIIEVNTSFCLALGYSKHDISNKNGMELGLLPKPGNNRQSLIDKGWEESSTSIFNQATKEWIPCHVLNTVILSGEVPMILCIVRDIQQAPKTDSEYIPSQLDTVISTRISGESH